MSASPRSPSRAAPEPQHRPPLSVRAGHADRPFDRGYRGSRRRAHSKSGTVPETCSGRFISEARPSRSCARIARREPSNGRVDRPLPRCSLRDVRGGGRHTDRTAHGRATVGRRPVADAPPVGCTPSTPTSVPYAGCLRLTARPSRAGRRFRGLLASTHSGGRPAPTRSVGVSTRMSANARRCLTQLYEPGPPARYVARPGDGGCPKDGLGCRRGHRRPAAARRTPRPGPRWPDLPWAA